MTQSIRGINKYTSASSGRNTIQDLTLLHELFLNEEGIITGLEVEETSPQSSSVKINTGKCAIDCGSSGFLLFELSSDATVEAPATGSAKYYIVALEVDLTNATQEFVVLEGTAGTDPTMTEAGSPEVYYLEIARINHTGGSVNVTNAEIEQNGVNTTNNATPKVIAKRSDLNNTKLDETLTYSAYNTVTTPGNKVELFKVGKEITLTQQQAFTNDIAAGLSISISVASTSGFRVGEKVFVQSSAGRDKATITAITLNTSITVDTLVINHSTTDRYLVNEKKFIIKTATYSAGTTTITLSQTNGKKLVNTTISDLYISKFDYIYPTNAFNNFIIDGGYSRWDTGDEFTSPATNSYTATMNKIVQSVDGGTPPTIIHSQEFENGEPYYRVNTNGAGTSYGNDSIYTLRQSIWNGVRTLAQVDGRVTLKFEAKSSISDKKIGAYLFQYYGTGGSPSATESIAGDSFDLTSSWKEFEVTFTLNTLVGKTFGTVNNDFIGVVLLPQWGSNYSSLLGGTSAESFRGSGNIDIRRLRLVQAETAGNFVPDGLATLDMKVGAFFEKSYARGIAIQTNTGSGAYVGIGRASSATTVRPTFTPFTFKKVIVPSITLYRTDGSVTNPNYWDYNNGTYANPTVNTINDNNFSVYFNATASGLTTGQAIEVRGHWVADARP